MTATELNAYLRLLGQSNLPPLTGRSGVGGSHSFERTASEFLRPMNDQMKTAWTKVRENIPIASETPFRQRELHPFGVDHDQKGTIFETKTPFEYLRTQFPTCSVEHRDWFNQFIAELLYRAKTTPVYKADLDAIVVALSRQGKNKPRMYSNAAHCVAGDLSCRREPSDFLHPNPALLTGINVGQPSKLPGVLRALAQEVCEGNAEAFRAAVRLFTRTPLLVSQASDLLRYILKISKDIAPLEKEMSPSERKQLPSGPFTADINKIAFSSVPGLFPPEEETKKIAPSNSIQRRPSVPGAFFSPVGPAATEIRSPPVMSEYKPEISEKAETTTREIPDEAEALLDQFANTRGFRRIQIMSQLRRLLTEAQYIEAMEAFNIHIERRQT